MYKYFRFHVSIISWIIKLIQATLHVSLELISMRVILSLGVEEVLLKGLKGKAGNGGARVVEEGKFMPVFLDFDLVLVVVMRSSIQERITLEKFFIDAVEREQINRTKLQIFPGD